MEKRYFKFIYNSNLGKKKIQTQKNIILNPTERKTEINEKISMITMM